MITWRGSPPDEPEEIRSQWAIDRSLSNLTSCQRSSLISQRVWRHVASQCTTVQTRSVRGDRVCARTSVVHSIQFCWRLKDCSWLSSLHTFMPIHWQHADSSRPTDINRSIASWCVSLTSTSGCRQITPIRLVSLDSAHVSRQPLMKVTVSHLCLQDQLRTTSERVRHLGFIINYELTMKQHRLQLLLSTPDISSIGLDWVVFYVPANTV